MNINDKKKVNIFPRGPITSVNPPIRSAVMGVKATIKDIRKCIIAGARVDEILDNGATIPLHLSNYSNDNNGTVSEELPKMRTDIAAPPVEDPEKVEPKYVANDSDPKIEEKPVEEQDPVKDEEDAIEDDKVESKDEEELETLDIDSIM